MLQATLIGYLGADAEVKTANGKEFTTMRIAHSDKWVDDAGQVHENTTWVDCILNNRPNVVEYLKRGTQVYVSGSVSLRVYSSAKDRCMKAGMTINVRSIELIGGKNDDVPSVLYDARNGQAVEIQKHFYAPSMVRNENEDPNVTLLSRNQEQFNCTAQGWVTPLKGF